MLINLANITILPNNIDWIINPDDYVDPTVGWDSFAYVMNGTGSPNVTFAGDISYVIRGDARANIITTDLGNDLIHAGGGNDIIRAGGWNDFVQGGAGNDIIYGQQGADVLYGGSGNDMIYGGNLIDSGSGWTVDTYADSLFGGSGDDMLIGGAGGDALNGGNGFDIASYAGAALGVRANLANTSGNTHQAAGDTYTSIEGLIGTNHSDVLVGNASANRLYGGADVDNIEGGAGFDQLWGGSGGDFFWFRQITDSGVVSSTRDQIMDWDSGDVIDVSLIDARDGVAGNQAFTMDAGGAFTIGEIRAVVSGGHTEIQLNTDNDSAAEMTILLRNYTGGVSAADFFL